MAEALRDLLQVEVSSNDGYLLQYFVRQGVPVLGIELAANVAKVAVETRCSELSAVHHEETTGGA